ncbi:MAG: electron transfer flavoprotein subunit alpha/FixB family protein [Gammaproteobacteria bacterium]
MTIALLVAHAHDGTLAKGVNAALRCADDVHVLIWGHAAAAHEAAQIQGVSKVFYAENPIFEKSLAEPCATEIAKMGENYEAIIMAANSSGKNILPRVSGLLKRCMLSDVMSINNGEFVRPIYAGNALQTVRVKGAYLLSFRPTSFDAVTAEQAACPIEAVGEDAQNALSSWVSLASHPQDRPDLATAKYVVAGGRGLKSKEQFQLIEQLADCLGAAVGASRAAVDAGFVPNDCQVGQTGKIVAPALYIAIGISGAIQHLAGMKSSKVIVAINQDPDAPIFKIADYGWVTDLFVAIPELERALKLSVGAKNHSPS